MTKFINREEFKKYVLRKLGAGINRIVPDQLSPDQLDDCIEDAIVKFQRRHYDGSRKRVLVLKKDTFQQTEYVLPDTVIAVNSVLHGRYAYFNTGGAGSNGAYEDYLLYGRRQGGLSTRTGDGQVITPYYIHEQAFNTFTDVYMAKPQFTFSPVSKKLIMQSVIDRRNFFRNRVNALYIEIMEVITEDEAPDMYDHEWLKEYAVALVGVQWGTNITRFGNVALPGEATSNGDAMLARYIAERDALEEELEASGMVPGVYIM